MKKIGMQTIVFLASFVVVLMLVGSIARGGIVFLDDFEDGSATDGAPVTWTPWPGATGSFEVIDGDFVMTRPSNNEEMYCYVDKYMTLADTSIRTQARLIGSTAWWLGLLARGNTTPTMYALLLFNNGRLEIWRFGPTPGSSWILAGVDVGIDPRAQDVLLRFDAIGNELSAWAWREGDPMPAEPQVTVVHTELATGGVGIAADLGSRLSNNEAIFRYVEVYEHTPPTPDFNGDGIVDATDMCMMIDYWGTDEPLYDIAPPPFGDGIVDVQDLIMLAEHLFEGAGLVAHWALDETEGNVAYDSAGNIDAIVHEGQWTTGKIDGALDFDGFNTYMDCGDSLRLSTRKMTLAMWLEPEHMGGMRYVLSRVKERDDEFDYVLMRHYEGHLEFAVAQEGSEPVSVMSNATTPLNEWTHVAVCLDGSEATIYINGQLDASAGYAQRGSCEDCRLWISSLGRDTRFYNGKIDDIRIYNVALTADEIAALTQ